MPLQENRADKGQDGTVRKAHYGEGKQPWDTMVEMGIGAEFAAGSIIKYLRRSKDPEHSKESARWYYVRLRAMIDNIATSTLTEYEAKQLSKVAAVFNKLIAALTDDEIRTLVV